MATLFGFKPLFGTTAESCFGDKREFCRNLIARINAAGATPALPAEQDPEGVLRAMSESRLMELVNERDIDLDVLVPVRLTEDEIKQLFDQATRHGLATHPADAHEPPEDAVIPVLQMAALGEVCAPLQEWSAEKKSRMAKLRERHFPGQT